VPARFTRDGLPLRTIRAETLVQATARACGDRSEGVP
jgi:hypothetical protein